ncbi:hypothetical protein Q8W71_11610 [Methylobacterium sp. NEAU 140]|uniref:hypothetical protein n=1 Tax=Methylobacterium sp. NEAU 140 TaxID=3064945 RepID=UPI00273244B8|nr:hypothetical protein [Methylobacterium sp. NEAU 140]MDP4023275.1 hypothetical protein [Methylobacterium sp. NEAU 140]
MPVSLDAMLGELSPESRTAIERDSAALIADCRSRAAPETKNGPSPSAQIAVGAKVRTGQQCPTSGLWRVADTPSATLPIAIHDLMPPYRDRAVTWELVRSVAA